MRPRSQSEDLLVLARWSRIRKLAQFADGNAKAAAGNLELGAALDARSAVERYPNGLVGDERLFKSPRGRDVVRRRQPGAEDL